MSIEFAVKMETDDNNDYLSYKTRPYLLNAENGTSFCMFSFSILLFLKPLALSLVSFNFFHFRVY